MSKNRPLVVDFDGTLLRSDTLVASAFAYIRRNSSKLLTPTVWLLGGKSKLNAYISAAVSLDTASLPYSAKVISFLEQEKVAGRTLILATTSHETYAAAIAKHLGLFDEVLAPDSTTNLTASTKRDVLVSRFGGKGFDYIGNTHVDLKVCASAYQTNLVDREFGGEVAASPFGNMSQVISRPDSLLCTRAHIFLIVLNCNFPIIHP